MPDLLLLDASVQCHPDGTRHQRPLDDFVTSGMGSLLRNDLWRYGSVAILTHDIDLIRKPFNKSLLLRLLARRRCWFEDESGRRRDITTGWLLRAGFRRLRAVWIGYRGGSSLARRIRQFEGSSPVARRFGSGPPVYLRTDLIFGLQSGGSVTHIAGVLNQLSRLPGGVRFASTDRIPTVADDVAVDIVRPDRRLWDVPEANALLMNEPLLTHLRDHHADPRPRFVYQRYSVNSIAGLLFAHALGVPFVLEYNGSEVWINRHWGRTLENEGVASHIEQLNLTRADLVVVVSEALAAELRERGVDDARVLVNPNGVDPAVYRPDLSVDVLKRRLGITRQKVVGFIGTFGPWHGAVVLVEAFGRLLKRQPERVGTVRLMMIGDGQQMTDVRRAIDDAGIQFSVLLPGRVPQAEGPAYLAACDILVSPHVPNPDGSAFFGSPTKLFEYMAMGRPIVASNLAQIGDVLSDGVDALLVPPGDADAMAVAIASLIDTPELAQRLATNARTTALERHTWERHTGRILARLHEVADDTG